MYVVQLTFPCMLIFKALVGSVILLSLAVLHPVLWLIHKLSWSVYGNSGADNIPHLACVCHYCIEMTFLGNLNVQLFEVHELLMVG